MLNSKELEYNMLAPRVGLRKGSVIGCERLIDVRSNVYVGSNHGLPEDHQTSPGCGNLVLAPSHTTSGETSICTPWTVAERANSIGICLAKSPLNLGQDHTSEQLGLQDKDSHIETYFERT